MSKYDDFGRHKSYYYPKHRKPPLQQVRTFVVSVRLSSKPNWKVIESGVTKKQPFEVKNACERALRNNSSIPEDAIEIGCSLSGGSDKFWSWDIEEVRRPSFRIKENNARG